MSEVQSHRIPESKCPKCGYVIDTATCVGDGTSVPSTGDISICIECASVAKYGQNLKLEEFTTEELSSLCDSDPRAWSEIIQAVNFIKSLKNDK